MPAANETKPGKPLTEAQAIAQATEPTVLFSGNPFIAAYALLSTKLRKGQKESNLKEIRKHTLDIPDDTFVATLSSPHVTENSQLRVEFWGDLDKSHPETWLKIIEPKTPPRTEKMVACLKIKHIASNPSYGDKFEIEHIFIPDFKTTALPLQVWENVMRSVLED